MFLKEVEKIASKYFTLQSAFSYLTSLEGKKKKKQLDLGIILQNFYREGASLLENNRLGGQITLLSSLLLGGRGRQNSESLRTGKATQKKQCPEKQRKKEKGRMNE